MPIYMLGLDKIARLLDKVSYTVQHVFRRAWSKGCRQEVRRPLLYGLSCQSPGDISPIAEVPSVFVAPATATDIVSADLQAQAILLVK